MYTKYNDSNTADHKLTQIFKCFKAHELDIITLIEINKNMFNTLLVKAKEVKLAVFPTDIKYDNDFELATVSL